LSNLQHLLSHLRLSGVNVLDVATGTGTMFLLPQDADAVAVDSASGMLKAGRRRGARAKFVRADARLLPFFSGSFDLVTAIGIFEYQADPLGFLTELSRVIKPAGHIIFTFAQRNFFNVLRMLTGHVVRMASYTAVSKMLDHSGLIIRDKKESLMQTQVLVSH
jgi:ubiquinone/menaquinone biosynthesis C-methylase UbiE